MIACTLHDSRGSIAARRSLHLAALPLVAAFTLDPSRAAPVLLLAGLALALPSILPVGGSRRVQIEVTPGALRLHGTGALGRKVIRSREVVGGSTARVGNKYLLTLALDGKGLHPVTLVLDREEDVAAVRTALAIGHAGFGTLVWPLRRTLDRTLGDFCAWTAALFATFGFAAVMATGRDPVLSFGFIMYTVFALASLAFMRIVSCNSLPRVVGMRSDGIYFLTMVRSRQMVELVPWSAMRGVRRDGKKLVIARHDAPPSVIDIGRVWSPDMPSLAQFDHFAAQAQDAVSRAYGNAPAKKEAETPVDMLQRAPGEPTLAWLSRIEAAAGSMDASGYRGGILAERDLWTLYEDPDADIGLRFAAARVLRRVVRDDDSRQRLEVVASASRDVGPYNRLRVALDNDVEQAARALAMWESADAMQQQAAQYPQQRVR